MSTKTIAATKDSAPPAGERRPFHRALALCALLIFLFSLIFAGTDVRLKTVTYTFTDARVKNEIRFVMLSDLHRSVYGKDQCDLIAAVDAVAPHAVFLCGDIFDKHGEYEKAEPLLRAIGSRYPCYFVSGNHEFAIEMTAEERAAFIGMLSACGIIWLQSEKTTLKFGETEIDLAGIEDPNRYQVWIPEDDAHFHEGSFYQDLEELSKSVKPDRFSILLCHRPMPDEVENCRFDLTLSGHCHGGQWRFPPLINGLYTPTQGLFPKYAGGRYTLGSSTLIVGRGLSKTGYVPRFCNRPEVVVIELKPQNG